MLAEFGGCVAKAAAFFGKERKQIYRWAKSFELEPEDFRDTELQDFGGAAGNEKGPAQCNNESP